MQEFIKTIKSFPDMVRKAYMVHKIAFKQSPWVITSYLLLSLISSLIPYTRNFVQGNIINILQTGERSYAVFALPLIVFMVIIVLPSILMVFQVFCNKIFFYKITQYFDNKIINKSVEVDPQLHEDKNYTNLVNKVNDKGVYVLGNFYENFWALVLNLITLGISAVTLYHFSKISMVIMIFTTLPTLFVQISYGRSSWFIWGNDVDTEKRKKYWAYRKYFQEFSTYIELKLTEAREYFRLFRSRFLEEVYVKQLKNEKNLRSSGFVSELIAQAGILVIFIILFKQVLNNHLQVGSFIFVLSVVLTFTATLVSTFKILSSLYPDYMYIKDLYEFLSVEPKIKNTGTKTLTNVPPVIEFRNVSFSYPGTDKTILKDFSLTINAGDKVAVIGLNGAGKTTFVKLLCRFYDATEGEILLNGVNIKDYDLESWYKNMGVLFQEYGKYHIPLEDLISLGRYTGTIDHKKLLNSLKIAEADFVKSLPNKEKTQLGKEYTDGVDVSVGQWQKLAIARMFYRDPSVMVLDEPTSSIDAEAEAKIFETLEKFSKDKTIIMISHRFSTVRNANTIAVIKEGSLHEYGTHEQLIKNNNEYARLFHMQAEGYK